MTVCYKKMNVKHNKNICLLFLHKYYCFLLSVKEYINILLSIEEHILGYV